MSKPRILIAFFVDVQCIGAYKGNSVGNFINKIDFLPDIILSPEIVPLEWRIQLEIRVDLHPPTDRSGIPHIKSQSRGRTFYIFIPGL